MATTVEAMNIAREPRGLEQNADQGGNNVDGGQFAQALGQVATTVGQVGLAGLQLAGGNAMGIGTLGGALGGLGDVANLAGGTDTDQQLALMQLQRQINWQSQVFNTMTNIEKAHHDARMAAIRNIRP